MFSGVLTFSKNKTNKKLLALLGFRRWKRSVFGLILGLWESLSCTVLLAQAHTAEPMMSVLTYSWEAFVEFPSPWPGCPVLTDIHAAVFTWVLPRKRCCVPWCSGLCLSRDCRPLPSPFPSWEPVFLSRVRGRTSSVASSFLFKPCSAKPPSSSFTWRLLFNCLIVPKF